MTTIAWDGHALAADTQASMFRGRSTKIHRLKDGSLFGSCGQVQDMFAVVAWLNDEGERPKVEDGFHAILIKDGMLHTIENKLVQMPQDAREFFAVGSGRDYAMAAMHLGKTAAEAVLVAHAFDVDTGSEVQQMRYMDSSVRLVSG